MIEVFRFGWLDKGFYGLGWGIWEGENVTMEIGREICDDNTNQWKKGDSIALDL